MARSSDTALKARKAPQQARSEATLQAIFEATIQVLLEDGAARLTTTRVAERAGVSVGSMYQYFPNKQSLLHAVLARHLGALTDAVEAACAQLEERKLTEISDGIVAAFISAKLERLDLSRALYRIAPELDYAELQSGMARRLDKAVCAALLSASDMRLENMRRVVPLLLAAASGATRAALEAGGKRAQLEMLQEELPKLCRAYLMASAAPRKAGKRDAE
jgi:AcrR family transcriptional regulator